MKIRITCQGTSQLLMHNPRLVDPDYEMTRRIKDIAGKRKKTDEDLAQISRLEWFGGLYYENGTLVQPTSKVRKCLINTAKMTRHGTAVSRSLAFDSVTVPLIFDAPEKKLDELFENPKYVSRLSVVVGGKRVMRTRAMFFPWALELTGFFIEDAGLNFDDLHRITELAGTIEGIGDNRVNGYGRFIGQVEKIE
jgi:hypothetical protein